MANGKRFEDQHIWDLMDYLDEVDGKTVRITVDRPEDRADFDRKVRESIERQHRRAQIAGG
jgi:hypothetical protein